MQFRPSIATSRFCLRFASFVASNSASIRDFHRSSSNVASVIVVAFSSSIQFLRLCSLSKQHGSISLQRRNLYMHRRHSTVSALDSLSSSQNLSPRHHRIRAIFGTDCKLKFLHEHGQNFRRISLAFESTSRLFGRGQVVFVNEKYCRN
ncbi:hypothetical protein RYX36_000092 [Vicia faba]